jgi:hypothetical protein
MTLSIPEHHVGDGLQAMRDALIVGSRIIKCINQHSGTVKVVSFRAVYVLPIVCLLSCHHRYDAACRLLVGYRLDLRTR